MLKLQKPYNAGLLHKALMVFALVVCYFLFSHPDLWETANHSYLLLESVFKGEFLDFYNFVSAHENTYYYINNAHYNIFVYALFGIWQLPVFIINNVFSFALNEQFLWMWTKAVSVVFFIASGYAVKLIAKELKLTEAASNLCALFFVFNPIAFFGPMVMGQYDSMCVFFTLIGILFYLKGSYIKFCLLAGVGVVCKFFPLIIVVFLILLCEKRVLHIIKYLAITFWLYAPTTILFFGKTGNAAAFNSLMIDRLFVQKTDTSVGAMSTLVFVLAVLLVGVFLYTSKTQQEKNYLAIYLPLVLMGLLFIYVEWHPQWLMLLIPFVALTTFMQSKKQPWFIVDIVMCAGFFIICFFKFSGQISSSLFDGGLLKFVGGINVTASPGWFELYKVLDLIPYLYELSLIMFTGAIAANIIFKFPFKGETLCNRLAKNTVYDKLSDVQWLYAEFLIGFGAIWFVPVLGEMFNAIGVI